MKRSETTNTFQEGLVMDFNPLNTPSGTLSNCLNGTLITFNGDEYVLQNDMGNGRVETASLPQGYVPLGTAELGGIIYIVSYNPLINRCQIGSFPSPERNIAKEEIKDSTTTSPVTNENFVNKNNSVTSTLVKVKLLDNMKLNPGDKFAIYGKSILANKDSISDIGSKSHKIDSIPRYVTIRVVSIGDDGKITYLDDSLKWTQLSTSGDDYYIKESNLEQDSIKKDIDSYNKLVSSAYNVFKSKVSGSLALLFELKTIDSFTATWSATVSNYENNVSYQKQGNIFVDLNWTSQFSSLNPKAVKITGAKVTGNVGLLLNNGTILSKAQEIQDYLNSLTYTFKVDKASTVIASPKSIVNKPTINVNKPIKPEISQSIQEAKQEYLNSNFEAELAIKDIITLNGEYLRANDGTDKPTSVMVGKFLYSKDNPGTISFSVTPIMPYGNLTYLTVSNTINLLDVGTGKVTISRWKYFVNDSQTFIDFGINAYPEVGCSIEKVFLKFFSVDDIINLKESYYKLIELKNTTQIALEAAKEQQQDDLVARLENEIQQLTNKIKGIEDNLTSNIESIKSHYQYTLDYQTNYSGNYKLDISSLVKDQVYLVDICANYSMSNGQTICKHNFRWLFMNEQFNELFLDSRVVDFNDKYLDDVLNVKLAYNVNNSTQVRSEQHIPELLLENPPDDNGKYKAMGTQITTVSLKSTKSNEEDTNFSYYFDQNVSNYSVTPYPTFENNNIFSFRTVDYFQELNSSVLKGGKISTDAKEVESDYDTDLKNVIAPVLNTKLGLAEDLANTIKQVEENGITESLYEKMIDSFDIKQLGITNNTTINFNVSGASFGKINADIASKTYNITQTIRPLLLYAYEYSKFGLKPYEDNTKTPILKYIFGEGHQNLGGGDPFAFKFGKYDSKNSTAESPTISDGSPITVEGSGKKNWNPGDDFTEENYWDYTPPYTNYLNKWMLTAGGPFQILLFKRHWRDAKNISIKFDNYPPDKRDLAFLWVKTSNNHFIPIDTCWFWGTSKVDNAKKDLNVLEISKKIAALLMQIYYIDTTPKQIKKYTVYGINSIKSYNNTVSTNVQISAKTKLNNNVENSLEALVTINNSRSIHAFKDELFRLPVVGEQIKENVNNISFSIGQYDITDTYKLSYKINVYTDNLTDFYNLTKNQEYSTYYIIPDIYYRNSKQISSGFISPINPHYLYVLDRHNLDKPTFNQMTLDTAADSMYDPSTCKVSIFHSGLNCEEFGEKDILYLQGDPQYKIAPSNIELLDAIKYDDSNITFDEEMLLGNYKYPIVYFIDGGGYGVYYSNSHRTLNLLGWDYANLIGT